MWQLAGPSAVAKTKKRRNVILVLIDDQRYDAMSCMGHPFLKTPNLDRLAAGGAHFKNAFVTTSLCSPSRATILTGQYAHVHGIIDNQTRLRPGTPTFPQELQKAGYKTGFVGKWHMGGSNDAARPGFDRWVSFRGQGVYNNPRFNVDGERVKRTGYVTDLITDYALEFLKEAQNGPFFLYMSHKAVHAGFVPAERHKSLYADVELEFPASMADTEENYRGKPAWVRNQRNSFHGVDNIYQQHIPLETVARDYCRTLVAVDDSIGRLIDALEDLGLLESTLIIYMGDNGFMLGEHGLIDKRAMYEESIRIPFLVHCPEIVPAGQSIEKMVLNIDVAPTVLDAAGADVPPTVQGRSFLPLARRESTDWRTSWLYEYFWESAFPQTPTVFGVRTDRHKYMKYHGVWDTNELYDLENDPLEMTNLMGQDEHRKVGTEMRKELSRLLGEFGAAALPSWNAT